MSQTDHTVEDAIQSIAGHTRRITRPNRRGVEKCNGCGRTLEPGDPLVIYAVYKRYPGSDGHVWHPLANFCAEHCSRSNLCDVDDKSVGQPGGRPGQERYWEHRPEMLVKGTFATQPIDMYQFAFTQLYDHAFEDSSQTLDEMVEA